MEKKNYIAPEMEVIEFETESPLLALSLNDSVEVDTEKDQLSNRYRPGRRGQWGNLWYEGE